MSTSTSSPEGGDDRPGAKGKARAYSPYDTERTPLLASGSGPPSGLELTPPRRSLISRLLTVFLYSLLLCFLIFIVVAIIAYSYTSKAAGASPDQLIERAVVVRGPDRLDVLNVTAEGGIWLRVKGRIGVDAGSVLDVNTEEDDSMLRDLWKSLGRWGVHRLDTVSLNLTTIDISSRDNHLANVTIPPLELHLTVNPPRDDTWLSPVTIPMYIQPTKNASALIAFLRESWRDGRMFLKANVGRAVVRGGGLHDDGLLSKMAVVRSDVETRMNIKIPHVPGLPPPGRNDPLPSPSHLVKLQSFRIMSDNKQLRIEANATAVNPAPLTFHYTSSRLPFTIFIPAVNSTTTLIPVASVETAPFSLTHPNISLDLTGEVLPLAKNASTTISTFIANYISAQDSDLVISSPLFPYATVDAVFPALHPKPQVLRNVTIRDMKIIPTGSGNTMLASGTIFARVVLPEGIQVGLNVTRVLPDVLVFDGEVPDHDDPGVSRYGEPGAPPAPPLPDPLPERAFAHIRPDDWLPSTSFTVESGPDEGTTVEVLAKIVDVPLEVLPGRDREFRKFVGKVIFGSQGAMAGVQGVAAVSVRVEGLPFGDERDGEMELDGLPFQGNVRIGKRSTFLMPGTLHD